MKNFIALALLAGAVFATSPSHAASCAALADTDCTTTDGEGQTVHCAIYVHVDGIPNATPEICFDAAVGV